MEPDPIPTDNRPEWLKALTEKSWNLELVISGAAIFLANYLPDAVDNLLRYYLENFVLNEDFTKIALPLLVYSFMKVIAWLLILTFVAHFVMRAFWAGVVGLHTVYPDGIRYERLPWQSDITRNQMRERFGLLSDYILRLDRLCNQIFSAAFLIALTSLGICIAYIFIFLIFNILPIYLGAETGKKVGLVFLSIMLGIAMLPLLTQTAMRIPRLAAMPFIRRLLTWSARYAGNMLMPLIYRPMTYLNLAFTSQMSARRLISALVIGTVFIMGAVILTFTSTMLQLSGRLELSTRDFFASERGAATLTGGVYDNMRAAEDRLPPISLPSEIVEGPFLRVFVDYPKLLDAALSQRCTSPVFADSIPRAVRRAKTDSIHLACMNSFFRLSLNDSLIAQPGWMFHVHPVVGSTGVVAYLPSSNFKPGKNILKLEVPSTKNPDSLRVYGQAPFWFARD